MVKVLLILLTVCALIHVTHVIAQSNEEEKDEEEKIEDVNISLRDSPNVVERANWGIVFIKVGTLLNGFSKYKHTFRIDVPDLSYKNITNMPCSSDEDRLHYCETVNVLVDEYNRNNAEMYRQRKIDLDAVLSAIELTAYNPMKKSWTPEATSPVRSRAAASRSRIAYRQPHIRTICGWHSPRSESQN